MSRAGRSLDRRLAAIAAGQAGPDDFIIADAKDADMAFGIPAAGPVVPDADEAVGPGRYRTRAQYLEAMRAVAAQGEIDVLLTSASNGQRLAFDGVLETGVTLAVRANDTTDIWAGRVSGYPAEPSLPFRTARLDVIRPFCDLVLYSITFNNRIHEDRAALAAYRDFRVEAGTLGVRHFLEVFNPNAPANLAPEDFGAYVNDSIVRALAGVVSEHRPQFLKVAFNGHDALAELVDHDPSLVIGVLGGSSGTTRDVFELLHRAAEAGARVALFGRKIQRCESQLDLIRLMRPVVRGNLSSSEAVRAYHDALAEAGITPHRPLAADLEITEPVLRAE